MSISLHDVVDAIERYDDLDYYQTYYDRKKDILISRRTDDYVAGEVDEMMFIDNDLLVPLPNARDLDEYSILENFILQLDDRYASAILYNCIQGKGAFKRFKETCDLLGLLPAYWQFQHNEHVVIAREFCEQNNIEYYEDELKQENYKTVDESADTEKLSVIELIRKFIAERDWDQFHSPDNLAKSICIEAGELLECFQWSDDYNREDVEDELADVMIYCLQMCDKMNMNPENIIIRKMNKNAEKYPVIKSKGNYTKYNSFKF